jgi:hypothetical protein
MLVVVDCDGAGLMTRLVSFEARQLDDALEELDRRRVELGGSEIMAKVWARTRDFARAGNPETLERFLTEDFVDIDQRSLGKGNSKPHGVLGNCSGRLGCWHGALQRRGRRVVW